ncbi:hypothetical protein CERSUDRAFT_110502 [Gelatoporia subvermispora B]|uniref:Uncharacterized protein n=1 Tax=Ceriporiopsis subvermispora (strain B) TaxID=914234 RepID=M2RU33_CERS8|nr:hypothetical protein CERSUDRAFT_110502 [Gelatoporia subvermispora B]
MAVTGLLNWIMRLWRSKFTKRATLQQIRSVCVSIPEEQDDLQSTDSHNTLVGKQDAGKADTKTLPEPPTAMTSPKRSPRYPWSRRPLTILEQSPPPFPRYGHTLTSISDGRDGVWLFGGVSRGDLSDDVYVLHLQDNTIKRRYTEGTKPAARTGHAAVAVHLNGVDAPESILIWGGQGHTGRDTALYVLDISSLKWTQFRSSGQAPDGRVGHTLVTARNKVFLFGGDVNGRPSDELWICDIDNTSQSATWSRIPCADGVAWPPARINHTCVTDGENLYIFGGTDCQFHYNDTWMFSLKSQSWDELMVIGFIPANCEGHKAVLVGDYMYVHGGRGLDATEMTSFGALNIRHRRWFMFQNMGPSPGRRADHAMAEVGANVVFLGGEPRSAPSQNTQEGESTQPHMMHVLDTARINYPKL